MGGGHRRHYRLHRGAGCVLNRPASIPLLLVAAALAACGGRHYAPVSERVTVNPTTEAVYRVVNAGDTLYSVAWEANLDYRDLARWNNLRAPYVIKPGDRLRLRPPKSSARRPAPPPTATTPARPAPATRSAAPSPPAADAGRAGPMRWRWPAAGRVIRGFSKRRGIKGIDIAGRRGSPVRAAESGTVVYRGSGLRGYGQLIIVKHNESYLSAYAHNEKLIVREGERVRRGQRIASLGSTGTDRPKLHFEIRKRGVPVDPLRLLPRR